MRGGIHDSTENQIARLKRELTRTREALIELSPEKIRYSLHGYIGCKSREEANRWEGELVDSLIESAEILPGYGGFSDRANCPVCGYGGQSPLVEGFTLPEGLRRHLIGWGNIRQCSILDATMRLAREYWDEKFHEAELAEEQAKQAALAARKKSETLYRVSPHNEPDLADATFRSEVRDPEGMLWAEGRLKSLGFQVRIDGMIKTYLDERPDFVVYADPRLKGEIKFTVFKLPLKKKRRHGPNWSPDPYFRLSDSWKNDLPQKYETRVQGAVKLLSAR